MFLKKQLNFLNLKHNLYPIIIWLIPVFIAFIAQMFSFGINRVLFKNALENTATAVVFVSFALIFRHKASRVLQHILFYIFVFTNLFESAYFSIFKANISASSIFIILETNFAEATEFVDFYFNPSLILIGLFFIVIAVIYAVKPAYFKIKSVFKYQKIIFVLGVILPILAMSVRDYLQFNFIYLSVQSVREYITEQEQMLRFNIDQPTADIKGFVQEKEIDEATFVMIIGESTTRNRMSLYGYEKETTPYLDEIQSEIYKFDDVVTSHAYTIGALKDALTLHSLESTDDFSIVQLMNEAGFKTFWLSNQRPIGQYESLVTKIAMASDVYTPKNTALDGSITPFDEVLIPAFDEALKDPAKKKFIILHPLGTHMKYSDRYPSTFEHFKAEESNSSFDHQLARQRSSFYDNAVLYHDFFIQRIHEKLTQLQEASFMLYFSDHGDEVYDTIDFAGHLDDQPTPDMYEIPFFLWTNQAYQNEFSLKIDTKRPAVLRDLMHSFSDLLTVKFDDYKASKSLFSDEFKSEDRIIGNGINYDKELKR
ncbi:MAG: sulfatase-like hydrolase/transferase [Flavobacteriaceae bacterium]|nr:sulfatase-like hydrolase/transferase [Psychroflexus sp.]